MRVGRASQTWVPGLGQFAGYQRSWLRGDVLAGVTVAAYLVPQVMAYATVAGLPPVAGLWAALAPMAVYAVLGSSRQLSVGPESTTALMTATALAPLAIGDPARYAAMSAVLALLVGVICLAAGLGRLGFLAELLSRPVLVGYMTGVAVIMISGQLGKVTGVDVTGDEFIDQVRSFVTGIGSVQLPTVVLSATVLVLLLVLYRISPRFPGPLVAVLIATAVVWLFSLDDKGIRVVGGIPSGLPNLTLPPVTLTELVTLVVPAIGIAVVAFSDNALTARTFAARKGETVDANAELRALGVCNLTAGVTQGFPVSSSGSRTALGDTVGSRTQLYSLVMLATVLAVMLAGRDLLEHFPMAALGALVVYAALRLIDVAEFRRLARFRRSELLLAVATTAAVLGLGVLYGVLVAITLSLVDALRRIARPHDSVLGYVPGIAGMHDVDDYPEAELIPGLVVYRYDAPLFFANAEDFRERALAAVAEADGPVEWFVLNAEAQVDPDLTAVDALEQLRRELTARGIVFAMARVKSDLRDDLVAAGFVDRVGTDRIFPTLPTAVAAFRNR
ncbi:MULTISPECIES: SulP family inorganic anion transporter [Mycolicibacterium]|uniref:Sulfate ABC transporter n=1 Tax=Mycolicibacterium senegalense TaxID=1796 RepID=A0A378W5M4_9MYCO|nr:MULTISPECIES: sulfate permease [Mycolicibacterium]MCV7334305.1 sulfate permease [Mycolicibacterium senegalense]MDR7288295.1 high affinity sulfate transporter 1 [Mycolicibacterium senegalense]QZA25256.1 sulfate permease [Mycolicibacterium senegalense]CDP85788.1 sulfate ABC transporter [Mycolicibacterium farcinogenes]SUA28129.1 sulfate ABC transporter [Mycolicibacterium senegalense]